MGSPAPLHSPPRAPGVRFVAALSTGAVAFGLLAGSLTASGKGTAVVGLAVVLLPVLVWRRPYLAPAVLVGAALLIEQFPTDLGTVSNLTGKVPLFHGLGGMHLSPADLLLFALAVLALVKARGTGVWARLQTPASASMALLAVAVLVGVSSGMMHHGDIRISMMELRPYVYLIASYVLCVAFLTNREAIRAVLWAIVGAAGLKSLQALLIFLSVRHMDPRPEAVLGHEEAMFFGVFLILTGALCLFEVDDRLRRVATRMLPLVILGDLVNTRRAAWLVVGGGFVVLAIIGAKALPHRRLMLARVAAVIAVVLAVYVPAFWNKSGGTAQPARAIRSMIAPSERDASSDLYRVQEDENLKINIREGGLLGRGFGVPIDYPLEIADISGIDPLIAYIPHNGVLYVLMRMGVLGGIAMWTMVGFAIIGGARLARAHDRLYAAIGATVAAAMIGYAMEGNIDQGFFFYRIAFYVGTLLGLAEAARQLDAGRRLRAAAPARAQRARQSC